MKTTLTTLLVTLFVTTYSQVPGYLGKRLSILYDPTVGLSLPDLGDGKGSEVPAFGINFRNDFEIEYCISRGVSVGPTLKFLSTKMYDVNVYGDSDFGDEGFIGDIRLKSMAFGVKVKNYSFIKRGSIAPVGKYISFELLYEKSKASTHRYYDYNSSDLFYPTYSDPMQFEETGYAPEGQIMVILGGGGQNIYFDKLMVDLGYEIGYSIKHFVNIGDLTDRNYDVFDQESFADAAGMRIAGAYFLNFTFGFGYLVF